MTIPISITKIEDLSAINISDWSEEILDIQKTLYLKNEEILTILNCCIGFTIKKK